MIQVHHLNNSRSQRILWLLEELGVPYEVIRYERDPQTMLAPPELRQIHPLGKSPLVVEEGEVLAETGAIVEALLERHGAGRLAPPPGTPAHRRFRYWLHFAEGSAMTPLLVKLYLMRVGEAAAPVLTRIDANLAAMLDYLEAEVAKEGYFAGPDLTAADVMMSFPLEAATSRGGLDASRPALFGLLRRLQARPAYRQALERGGPYAYAP
ncbi:glutathione S-transferase family protein [Belnapia rosea]|uniref:glutathione transferase n=1 Tax=Belnapia rosea TaxID=938405 RepID=A0A1G6UTD2_9PROT|nr:glutathione S-transferase [Belnapia rosea]SDB72496.1 glutathione S-transferase [Belnapia rosea]SDD44514.1 glutathione S-transferase [Belnapia rosea]